MTNQFWMALYVLLFFFFSSQSALAKSDYVLPYPSAMPGSKFYQTRLFWDEVKKHWYFGHFGQFKYSLKQSDKYLVEAKTLFEYKQYFLADRSLRKSDTYFKIIPIYLAKAKKENKNIDRKQKILKEAITKHIEVLNSIKDQVPESFLWQPEKSLPTLLELRKLIEESISIRKK